MFLTEKERFHQGTYGAGGGKGWLTSSGKVPLEEESKATKKRRNAERRARLDCPCTQGALALDAAVALLEHGVRVALPLRFGALDFLEHGAAAHLGVAHVRERLGVD